VGRIERKSNHTRDRKKKSLTNFQKDQLGVEYKPHNKFEMMKTKTTTKQQIEKIPSTSEGRRTKV
jgi:hypothetical protein